MPANNRLRLDQEERVAPPGREPSEEERECTIGTAQPRAPDLTTRDLELLAQQSILPAQHGGGAQVIEGESDEGGDAPGASNVAPDHEVSDE